MTRRERIDEDDAVQTNASESGRGRGLGFRRERDARVSSKGYLIAKTRSRSRASSSARAPLRLCEPAGANPSVHLIHVCLASLRSTGRRSGGRARSTSPGRWDLAGSAPPPRPRAGSRRGEAGCLRCGAWSGSVRVRTVPRREIRGGNGGRGGGEGSASASGAHRRRGGYPRATHRRRCPGEDPPS